jgi:hypothetical protein
MKIGMAEIAKPIGRRNIDLERLRCLRTGDLLKLYRHRWGVLLPDDDSGRADLFEILCVTSLALKVPAEKMAHTIETIAPWLTSEEAQDMIDHIQSIPIFERTRTARHLGDNMRLLNSEREALRLWTMLPIDMTDEQLVEQRNAKSRARRAAKRRQSGVRTRERYLAELNSKPKPWVVEGIHRRTWERRRAAKSVLNPQHTPQGSDATILFKAVTHPAASVQGEALKGLQGRGGEERQGQQAEEEQVVRLEPVGSHGLGTHLAAEEHPLMAAMQNWGVNAERKKNSTFSEKRNRLGWDDLSEFEAFSTDVPWCPLEALPHDLPVQQWERAA